MEPPWIQTTGGFVGSPASRQCRRTPLGNTVSGTNVIVSRFGHCAIEAFMLQGDRYVLAATAAGSEAVDLPPFTDLGLVPDALWPGA